MSQKALIVICSLCIACFLGGCNATDNTAAADNSATSAEGGAASVDGIVVKGNVAQVISKLKDFEESGTQYSGIEVTGKIASINWIDGDDGGGLCIDLSDDGEQFSSLGYASCVCGEAETMQTYAELNEGDTVTVYGVGFLFGDDSDPYLSMLDCDILDNN